MTVPLRHDDGDNPAGTSVAAYGPKQTAAIELSAQLADLITQEPHRFALDGDDQLKASCIAALKGVFDFAVDTEKAAMPSITATLQSALPDDDQSTSSRIRKRKRKSDSQTSVSHPLFEHTPVAELTVEGMKSSQLWEQVELRSAKVCKLLDTIITVEGDVDADEEEEEEEEEPLDDAERKLRKKRAKEDAEEETVHSLDQLTDAELEALGIDPSQRAEFEAMAEGMDSEEDEDEESGDDEGEYGYPGASDLSEDDEYSGIIVKEPLLSEEQQQKRKAEAEAAERRQIMQQRRLARMMRRFNPEATEGSDEEEDEENLDEDEEDEDEDFGDDLDDESEEDDDEEDEKERAYLSSLLDDERALDGPAQQSNGANVRRHAELDDNFFSIDQFNRDTDDYGDEGVDLGDDVDLFKSIDGGDDEEEEEVEEAPIRYADFFAPPPFQAPASDSKGNKEKAAKLSAKLKSRSSAVRFNDEVSVLHIKARRPKGGMQISPELLQLLQSEDEEKQGNSDSDEEAAADLEDEGEEDEVEMETDEDHGEDEDLTLVDEEDEDDLDEDDEQEDDSTEAGSYAIDREIATRVAGDLFDDDEDGNLSGGQNGRAFESNHQKRLSALQQEIAQLEAENVGKKDWTIMGEAGSRVRPENSLLEQDVEFESNRKAKPANTPETTQTIEEMIKKRILDDQFDDVQRRATLNPLDFLPSKMLELSDQKSSRSLGELYEDDVTGAEGQGSKLDKELAKEHEEIDRLYGQLEAQLDALSNAHYTPKAPEVSVQTLTNAPAITLEESLPSSMSHGSRLAPEEVYDAGSHNATLEGTSSELTPEEKRRRHRQLRDEKKARNERITAHRQAVEINKQAFGQTRGGRFVGSGQKLSNGNVAAEKDQALRKLMGNKGVSVVGKDGPSAKGRQNGSKSNGQGSVNAASLKL